jgi:hypothetical protein
MLQFVTFLKTIYVEFQLYSRGRRSLDRIALRLRLHKNAEAPALQHCLPTTHDEYGTSETIYQGKIFDDVEHESAYRRITKAG